MDLEQSAGHELATFAGGCFWCIVAPFEELPGVIRVIAGYTGGCTENPRYEEVCVGETGHFEAVQVTRIIIRRIRSAIICISRVPDGKPS